MIQSNVTVLWNNQICISAYKNILFISDKIVISALYKTYNVRPNTDPCTTVCVIDKGNEISPFKHID